MKRAHRTAHRTIWIVLAILIAAGFTMALVKRKPQKKKAGVSPTLHLVLHKGLRAENRS
ncbi:MAG: hypothetical protein KDJ29_03145 [Hyphomicrobiales bacterium]|nr:hypothetical protein [Hyphomicrobiales bacterium]